ncbi:MAG: site-specific integrase [Pontiella sp.]
MKNYQYFAGIIKSYPWPEGIQKLTKPDIVDFRSWLLKRHSRDVSRKTLTAFHSMVLELISRGVINHDVAAGITVLSTSRYDAPMTLPTEQEIYELLAAADRLANSKNVQTQRTWERYRPMLYLAVDSGMRPQEYLVVSNSALKETGVKVERALEGGGMEITVPKTRAGHRLIDLSAQTLDMVRHYSAHHAVDNKYDLVFPSKTGRWQNVPNWNKRGFNRACEEAGLMVDDKPKYRPYDLRHFYASMLIDQRVNLKRIQTLMGHRSIKTTLNVYGHLIERVEAKEQERTSVLTVMNHS